MTGRWTKKGWRSCAVLLLLVATCTVCLVVSFTLNCLLYWE